MKLSSPVRIVATDHAAFHLEVLMSQVLLGLLSDIAETHVLG
jgi:hypothetical protein